MHAQEIKPIVILAVCMIGLLFAGCKTSEKSSDVQKSGTNPTGSERIAAEVRNKADSIAARAQAEARILPPPKVTGKYAVQIGAYTTPENALKIADLAKQRFNLLIYTFHDKTDNLYKVFIGDFSTKDDARNYRDEMVRKFPGEYNDAWVSEHPAQ
jgi:cell division septation protein DedD